MAALAPFPLDPEVGSSDWQTEPDTGVFGMRFSWGFSRAWIGSAYSLTTFFLLPERYIPMMKRIPAVPNKKIAVSEEEKLMANPASAMTSAIRKRMSGRKFFSDASFFIILIKRITER